jgi:hypothetical protein
VFGFLINTPIVSYYEVGTILTPNHGQAAMMGVFGMLAPGDCKRRGAPPRLPITFFQHPKVRHRTDNRRPGDDV